VAAAKAVMQQRLPMTAEQAVRCGFYDACLPDAGFDQEVARRATSMAGRAHWSGQLADKIAKRQADEASRPLAAYRSDELKEMRRNFYGFDASYHVARFHFVMRSAQSWTPRHLAIHRDLAWKTPT
jgi:putative two-component system hydrogenase maturation factor HypX/HoxX